VLRIGLTGGIGSGKSTVARLLAAQGAAVVDADALAREVLAPGSPGLDAVAAEFGAGVLGTDGALDRAALASLVFSDLQHRQALEAITHPAIAARTAALVAAAPSDAVLVHDVPLLVEKGMGAAYHLVLVVDAAPEVRLRRLLDRGLVIDDARGRMAAQATTQDRRAAADVWLDNGGDLAPLEHAARSLWQDRLVPFEANLRLRRPAPRPPRVHIAEPDPAWSAQGRRLLDRIATVGRGRLLSAEHIGSTSVPGLPAKDVLDLQLVVADLATARDLGADLVEVGLLARDERSFDELIGAGRRDKVMAVAADPARAVHVHIRDHQNPQAVESVLLRDYLRAHPDEAGRYAAVKRDIARGPYRDVDDYASRKTPFLTDALERARAWSGVIAP